MSLFGSLKDIGEIASIGGGLLQAGGSIYGAVQGAVAADRAADLSKRAYKQQQRNLAPYMQTGQMALQDLQDIYLTGEKDFTAAPGYDYRVSEGQKAIERSAAARGMLNSGATLRALQEYGQNEATAEYDRNFGRLSQLAGFGAQAAPQANQASQNLAINVGGAGMDAAAARASGFSGVGSAATDFANNMLTLDLLRRHGGIR